MQVVKMKNKKKKYTHQMQMRALLSEKKKIKVKKCMFSRVNHMSYVYATSLQKIYDILCGFHTMKPLKIGTHVPISTVVRAESLMLRYIVLWRARLSNRFHNKFCEKLQFCVRCFVMITMIFIVVSTWVNLAQNQFIFYYFFLTEHLDISFFLFIKLEIVNLHAIKCF